MPAAAAAGMTTAKVLRLLEPVGQAAVVMVLLVAAPFPAARALLIPAVVVEVEVTAIQMAAVMVETVALAL